MLVALAAGMLAAVNPCGFALLPAYLGFLVLDDRDDGKGHEVRNAIKLTAAMTVGFAAVFGIFGLVVAPLAGSIQQHLPWFTIVLGFALAGCGGWLLAGRALPTIKLPTGKGPITRSPASMVAFGASYAVASIGCTIGPFLAIVVGSFRANDPLEGVALYLAYAAGMGITVGVAAVSVALARQGIVSKLRNAGRLIPRLAGALMVAVGAYVAYYGRYELRGATRDPIIDTVDDLQRTLANALERIGAPTIAVALVAVVAAAAVLTRRRRQKERAEGT
ncbi:cytochrome c biogenesis CcdA family protein [Tenggerimyces flavus]|uniref:Cytochrome c biogenesis CcdA family protein n=1 Tax=Tenggerimyces flavus TaxID=1708749 RepID=A0ABV7YII3_9ACTN|nr:cytochrome c biogenesis CcdA family protein [Tenggerimyces flavus]MBM7789306.1 cytochrome c biogenesis protein CcdA [Tenggerimyces flavus]